MNLTEKLAISDKAIESIARHDDEDAAVRHAALDAVQRKLDYERTAIDERVHARAQALQLKPAPATSVELSASQAG